MNMVTEQLTDTKKMETVLQDYATYWNNNDMDAWGKLFTDDVDYINRNGGWWKNNNDNIEGHKLIHKKLVEMGQPKTFCLDVQKITFLKPDVAIVQALSEWTGFIPFDNGKPNQDLKGIITCVFLKIEGEWLIRTLHNTLRS
jgi:uncharacterized protein (TIGR02246 family)